MLIGARNGMLVKRGYTAKSYPFMPDLGAWDGIENAGFGLHKSNPTQWVDLSGNNRHFTNLDCLDGFSDDAAIFVNRTGSVQQWKINPYSIKTIEVVGKSAQTDSYLAFCFSSGWGGTSTRIFSILPTNNRGFQFKSDGKSMYKDWWSKRWFAACTFGDENNPIQYYNAEVGQLNTGTSNWVDVGVSIGYVYSSSLYGYSGEICRVCLHSTVLTQEQLAANYVVHRARFNLP